MGIRHLEVRSIQRRFRTPPGYRHVSSIRAWSLRPYYPEYTFLTYWLLYTHNTWYRQGSVEQTHGLEVIRWGVLPKWLCMRCLWLSQISGAYLYAYSMFCLTALAWNWPDGTPRHVFNVKDQLEDYRTVIKYVRQQPKSDAQKVILFGVATAAQFSSLFEEFLADDHWRRACIYTECRGRKAVSRFRVAAFILNLPSIILTGWIKHSGFNHSNALYRCYPTYSAKLESS